MSNVSRKFDWLYSSVVTIIIAAATGLLTVLWHQERTIMELDRDISRLRTKVYRQQLKIYELFENHFRAEMSLIEFSRDEAGKLTKQNRATLNYYENAKEGIVLIKENHVEENKHEDSRN